MAFTEAQDTQAIDAGNADLIERLRLRVRPDFLNGPDSDCSEAADVIAAQDCTIAELTQENRAISQDNAACSVDLFNRAEAAEAGLRDLMEVTMKQLSPEQWKAIEPVVRDVRSLANPRAEIAEARIRAQDKTIALLKGQSAGGQRMVDEAHEILEASGKRIAELTKTIASLQDVLEDVIELVPVRPEYSSQIYRASVTLAQTLAEGTQK